MNGATIGDDIARARALGIALTLDVRWDRAAEDQPAAIGDDVHENRTRVNAADRRGPFACPTCDDGVRTIESPARCRECVKGGL